MRTLIAAIFTAGALLGGIASADAATPPANSIDMGGINLTAYCQHLYGPNYKSTTIGNTALSWYCVPVIHHVGATQYYPLGQQSMNSACLFMYRLPGVFAVALTNAPTSWECFRKGGPGIHMG